MRKMMFALCAGLLAAHAAAAQVPAAMPKPASPAPVVKLPAAQAPMAAPAPVVVAAPVVTAAPVVGCGSGCGTAAPSCAPACDPCAGKAGAAGKVFGNHKLGFGGGTATPVDCTCHAASKTFIFGSCKDFFNPARTCNGINLHGGRDRCPLPPYAAPYGKPAQNCAGAFSYLDR